MKMVYLCPDNIASLRKSSLQVHGSIPEAPTEAPVFVTKIEFLVTYGGALCVMYATQNPLGT